MHSEGPQHNLVLLHKILEGIRGDIMHCLTNVMQITLGKGDQINQKLQCLDLLTWPCSLGWVLALQLC